MRLNLRVPFSIGNVSFKEIVRDKILYNIFVIAILLLGLGFLAARLTFIRPDRVVLDFGVSAVNLSSVAIAALIGSSLINREIERRTMFLALSRPISRYQFVTGKFLGLCWVLLLNWLIVSGVFLAILAISGGLETQSFSATLFWALFLLLFQSFMMASIAIFFSTFTTTSLSAVFAVGIYLIGNNISQIHGIAQKVHSPTGAFGLNLLGFVIPNLEYFDLGLKVTYGIPVPFSFVLIAIGYSFAVSAVAIAFAGLLIQMKEA